MVFTATSLPSESSSATRSRPRTAIHRPPPGCPQIGSQDPRNSAEARSRIELEFNSSKRFFGPSLNRDSARAPTTPMSRSKPAWSTSPGIRNQAAHPDEQGSKLETDKGRTNRCHDPLICVADAEQDCAEHYRSANHSELCSDSLLTVPSRFSIGMTLVAEFFYWPMPQMTPAGFLFMTVRTTCCSRSCVGKC